MHRDNPYFLGMIPLPDKLSYYRQHAPMESVFNGGIGPPFIKPLTPFHSVDIQPSNACPPNFVIFDQTANRSQIMFQPEISSKFFQPGFGVDTNFGDHIDQKDANVEIKPASPLKEDSDDIDALLSIEDDETEECDDDEVSTARTDTMCECNSPDSCCNYESLSGKSGSRLWNSSGSRRGNKKHKRIKKMVKALRGIVPGANRMSTVAVLDEAVRYMKSLRVEVKKLGVRNSRS